MASRDPVPDKASSPDVFGTLQREVNRVFDQMFGGGPAARFGAFAPSLEMKEGDGALVVTAELPGMEEKDIELSVDGDILTISGEKKQEKAEEKEGFHLSERSYGAFRRSVRLPFGPDPAKAEASFEKGVLRVTLPRPPEAAPTTRRIPIGGATGG